MTTLLRRQRGFTLAELMIAVAIGLVMLAAMTGLFMNSSKAQSEIEKANRQIENGRYAIQLLSGDARNAGFMGEFNPSLLTAPGTLPDPCADTLAELRTSLYLHVQGIDNISSSIPDCISDVKSGTDVLVVRHAATCVAGEGTCDPVSAGGPFIQVSRCNSATELGGGVDNYYRLDTATASLDRTQRNCTTAAPIRRYEQYVYFIANNNNGSDGIPTLKRAELGASGNTISYSIAPLVEGVENMQLEYGLDTSGDGVSDSFTNDPATVANWANVVAVRVNILSRNLEKSIGYSESRTYTLGNLSDGSPNTYSAGSDGYKRHVFQALVGLPNPAGRRMN